MTAPWFRLGARINTMSTPQLITNFTVEKDGVRYEFEPGDRGGYVVHVPAYPSCASEGEHS